MTESSSPSTFDEPQAHRFFAANCFNRTWELIDQPDRTPADDEQMLLRASASVWHWTQRDDCKPRNMSIGYWLLSRVHALLGQPEQARHFGELSLQQSAGEPPFYIGYAQEALARAAKVAGDKAGFAHHLAAARDYATQVAEPDDHAMLTADLDSLAD